jgi:hypothetical protein
MNPSTVPHLQIRKDYSSLISFLKSKNSFFPVEIDFAIHIKNKTRSRHTTKLWNNRLSANNGAFDTEDAD